MEKKFCIANGDLVKIDELRSAPIFMLNDYVTDILRLYNTKTLCLGMHIKNIQAAMAIKHKNLPPEFTAEYLDRRIRSLLNVNNVYKGGYCRLLVYWQTFPEQTEPHFCIFTEPLESVDYKFNTKGYILEMRDLQTEIFQYIPLTSQTETPETLICEFDKHGKTYAAGNHDIILIHDTQLTVCETTLPFTTYFLSYLARNQWKIKKVPYFTKQDFDECTEICICNQFSGIQWIRRLYHTEHSEQYASFATKQAQKLFAELATAVTEM